MTDGRYQIVLMTASSADEAARIARTLVEERLAACVNVVESCRSVYRWKDEIADEREAMMIAKTGRGRFDEIVKRVRELHSYEVPEIIAVDLESIFEGYAAFLDDALGGRPGDRAR